MSYLFVILLRLCFDMTLNLLFSFMMFGMGRKSFLPKKVRICLKWRAVPSSGGRVC